LLDVVKILRGGDITVEKIDNSLQIYQGRSRFKLSIFEDDQFPKFPNIAGKRKLAVDSKEIFKGLKQISKSIDNNNPKFQLNGALIDIRRSNTYLVGTDTRRLSIYKVKGGADEKISLIVPRKSTMEILKLFKDETFDTLCDETDIILKREGILLFSRLINGDYPDYNRVIPKEFKFSLEIPKKEFMEGLKMVGSISQEVKIEMNRGIIKFQSLNPSNMEAKSEIPLDIDIDNFQIAVNSKYILDFLSQIESDRFEIKLNDEIKPFVLKVKQFLTVIMPIIV